MKHLRTIRRRTVLKTLGTGILASTLSARSAVAGSDTFTDELAAVRERTRHYRDVDSAERDGYHFFGVVPHAGVVYANPEYVESDVDALQHTDPPALLFYAPSEPLDVDATEDDIDETTLVLAGIEWLTTPRITDPTFDPDIFSDEEATRALKMTEVEGWHPFPDPDGLDVTGLHAWVHIANPHGVFARDHPLMFERIGD